MELIDATLIEFPLKNILTSIVLPPYIPSSHSYTYPSMSIFLEFETCMTYAPNLDRPHELDVAI